MQPYIRGSSQHSLKHDMITVSVDILRIAWIRAEEILTSIRIYHDDDFPNLSNFLVSQYTSKDAIKDKREWLTWMIALYFVYARCLTKDTKNRILDMSLTDEQRQVLIGEMESIKEKINNSCNSGQGWGAVEWLTLRVIEWFMKASDL